MDFDDSESPLRRGVFKTPTSRVLFGSISLF